MSATGDDGLTAWAAIRLLFPEPERDPKALFPDHPYDLSWDVPSFLGLLREGSWYAKGFRVSGDPTAGRERIQFDLWDILNVDLDDNTATGGGLQYEGLRFFEAKPEVKKTSTAEKRCREWLIEVMKTLKKVNKPEYLDKALAKFEGLSQKAFNRAWGDAVKERTTHTDFRKPGPVKRS